MISRSLTFLAVLCAALCLVVPSVHAQITSTASGGNWSATGSWVGGAVPGPTDDVIIADGATVTLDATATVATLQIGQGVSSTATLTLGNDATARTLTSGTLTLQSNGTLNVHDPGSTVAHTLSLTADLVNVGGTLDLDNGNGVANTTFANAGTAVLSGSGTNTFHDLTVDGGGNLIATLTFTVTGNFVIGSVTHANIAVSANNQDLNFEGNFTLNNGATFTTTSSSTDFNGASAQTLDLANGTAVFNSVNFDNSAKTINGNLTTNGGTIRVYDDATVTDQSTGNSHTLYNLRADHQGALEFNGSTLYFYGGTLSFGNNANTDGRIDLGIDAGEMVQDDNDVDLVFVQGNSFLQQDDSLVVDGDVTIQGNAQVILNGVATQVFDADDATQTIDSRLIDDGTHTLTVETNGDLYPRGTDNFPTSFGSYSFAANSYVRYDRSYAQTIRGEDALGAAISFARINLSGDAQQKTLAANEDLSLTDRMTISSAIFQVNHEASLTMSGDMYTSGDNADFNATTSTLYLNGTANQTIDAFDGTNDYSLRRLIITNPDNESRTVNLDNDIVLHATGTTTGTQGLFQASNASGSSANILVLDIDANQIIGTATAGRKDELSLGAYVRLQSSGETFTTNLADADDAATFDANSVVRLDGGNAQSLPDLGTSLGHVEFNGNGAKYLGASSLSIAGNVTRIGGNFVFNLDQTLISSAVGNPSNPTLTIGGNWNLGTSYTEVNGNGGTVVFNGADQGLQGADYENVTFSGSGTKTVTGVMNLAGNLNISTGVALTSSANINIEGDWTEASGATFTQTANTTTFNGGGTQTLVVQRASSFYDLDVENSSTLVLGGGVTDFVTVAHDFDLINGSTLDLDGAANTTPQYLKVARNLLVDAGATLSYAPFNTTKVRLILNGDVGQDLDNEIGGPFPTLQFEGVGEKDLADQNFDIDGNFIVAAEATVNGNNETIDFSGENWSVSGTFTHNSRVTFTGTATTISASNFNNINIGNGTDATTVTLSGNISVNGDLTIEDAATLDVSVSNYGITIENDFNNYGTFTPRQGTVTFVGTASQLRTQTSPDLTLEDQSTAKAFYNLTVNNSENQDLIFEDDEIQNSTITVGNNFTVESGNVRFNEDAAAEGITAATTQTLKVGGDFVFANGVLEYAANDINTIELNGSSASTHSIDLGGNIVREFQITGSDTYQLINSFEIRDDADDEFVLSGSGTLDLNGQIMVVNRGGLEMSNGTLQIDAGASLVLNDLAVDPDFNKTGGNIDLVGSSESPATLTALDAGGFTFTQSGGDFEANEYTIASTSGDGINITGGTITNFSSGLFTTGAGTAYLTLRNIALGSLAATDVAFNSGPTYNVSSDPGGSPPASGTITFTPNGGTLSGEADENDNPANGASDGFIRWATVDRFTWTGGTSTDWNTAANWSTTGTPDGNGNGYPDETDDVVFIESGASFDPVIDETVSIRRLRVASGTLTLNSGKLEVAGNSTITSSGTVTLTNATDSLKVAGSFANSGTFTQNSGKLVFNGTSGAHSISSSTSLTSLAIAAGESVVYGLGSEITVGSSFTLTGGTFDASSGFTLNIEGDWSVAGGTFSPGVGTVNFNGNSSNQNIAGGTLYNATFANAATKTFTGNVSIGGNVTISSGSGNVISDSGQGINLFVGDDWSLNQTDAFVANDGTVVFNGSATQSIGGSASTTFNNVSFQGVGRKDLNTSLSVSGNMTIVTPEVDVNNGVTVTGTGSGTFSMSGGTLDLEDTDNFPSSFGTVNLSGGTVRYFYNDNPQTIRGGIAYNNLQALSDNNNDVVTRTLGGDITVNGVLTLNTGDVTLDVAGYTLTLTQANTTSTNPLSLADDDTITWGANGTLVHNSTVEWDFDAQLSDVAFNHLTLNGAGRKDMQSNLTVNGDLTVGAGATLDQNTYTLTNDGGNTFTLGAGATYQNNSASSLPTGFATYTLDPTSTVTLDAGSDQALNTAGGTVAYGNLTINSDANITLDGNLTVEGNYDMSSNGTLVDNDGSGPYNITLNGSTIDLQNYIPSSGTTLTFGGADQAINDNEGETGDNLRLMNVVFGGSGTKTLTPNNGTEVTDVDGTLTINSGVTVTTDRGLHMAGTALTNNGTLNITNTGRPLVFDGAGVTVDPGTNSIGALTVNSTGTLTLQNNGLDIGNGDIILADGATIDFGTLTHHIASDDWFLNNTALNGGLTFGAAGTETTLIFDRTGTQRLPFIQADSSTQVAITNIPNITLEGTGQKIMTADLLVNDLTMESGISELDIDNTGLYDIQVRGNWTNNGTSFDEHTGQVLFYATTTDAKTITTNGDNFAELRFDGTADRTYTLVGSTTVEGEFTTDHDNDGNEDALTITRGTLDLNGNTLVLGNDDTDDPLPEVNTIAANGRLIIDEGAVLSFSTNDDDGDNSNNLEAAGLLTVFGRLDVDGVAGNAATITRSSGSDRIDINIESGATIAADNYSFSFLTDEGLEVKDGALLAHEDGTSATFSNGVWNQLATDAGPNTYLSIEADFTGAIGISNVTFNYDGTPTPGNHINVSRSTDANNNNITFTSTSGALGNDGEVYDSDAGDKLSWPSPTITTWQGTVSNDWTNGANWDVGVPSSTLEAVIALGSPYNPTYDIDLAGRDTIAGLSITTGILRLTDSDLGTDDSLVVTGDIAIGNGSTGTLITESGVSLVAGGSFEIATSATYDDGGITLTLNGSPSSTPIFSLGSEAVANVAIIGAGDYQFNGSTIDINGNLTVTGTASINPLDNAYNLYISGNISGTGSTFFNTAVDGEVILDGSTQSVTNFSFDELTAAGSGTKTLSGVAVADVFTVNSGVTVTGSGAISWANDVLLNGTFNGASGITYTFTGEDWKAAPGTYGNTEGTVAFARASGNQYIRQATAGSGNPATFHNLTLSGGAAVRLGRLENGNQDDGNVNMTGDLTVQNTINQLYLESYLIDNTNGSGTQTFTLGAGETVQLTGTNVFPSNFDVYTLDVTSIVRYTGTNDQTVRGGLTYGRLELENSNTKTLDDDIEVAGDLYIEGATLDVSANNYTVRVGGRYDTENGSNDGSFTARSGTVIFNGSADQVASIANTGTQDFFALEIAKAGGKVNLENAAISLGSNLNISDGELDVNALDVTINGSMAISGSGSIISDAGGTLIFTATSGTPTISTNGSFFAGNLTINAPGNVYAMLDDMVVDNVLTISAGTLTVNGNRLEAGNTEDVINISGTLRVSTATSPGGTLALGNQTQVVVQAGGSIELVGTAAQVATVTRRSTGTYGFRVTGSPGNAGSISAQNYLFEHMDANGIYIAENGRVNTTNNFSNGTFTNGTSAGTYLRIENSQSFLESSNAEIENVVFNDDPGGGAVNITKSSGTSGTIELGNYTGEFSGETFDSDPNNLIVWLEPDEILWTGTTSTDWFEANNWSTKAVPTANDDVVIPSSPAQATLNQPVIGNNAAVAATANLTIQGGNSLTINTTDSDSDLEVNGTLTLESSSTLQSTGSADSIAVGGSMVFNGSPSFNAGTGSTFTFNATSGLVTINPTGPFNNVVVDVDGSLNLQANTTVNGSFYMTDTVGTFALNGHDLTVGGHFQNKSASASAFSAGTNALILQPASASTYTLEAGSSEYYDLTLGNGITAATYQLAGNLSLSNTLDLTASTTLDPNGHTLASGDSDSDLETVTLSGTLSLAGGEQLSLGSGTVMTVPSGGSFTLAGSSGSPATLTRKGSSGNYSVTVASGGTFGASHYAISHTGGNGISIAAGATLSAATNVADLDASAADGNDDVALDSGSFSNGAGTAYLTLANTFSTSDGHALKAPDVNFGAGPIYNVSRNGSLDDLVFVDPSGSLQGANFEDDDQNTPSSEATTGNLQWSYNNPLYTWSAGNATTTFTDDANWNATTTTGSGPGSSNTVVIANTGGAIYPTVAASTTVASLAIEAGAQLTVAAGQTLTVNNDFTNSGTITINGNLVVNGKITNDGTINPGASSTVTLNVTEDLSFAGGSAFNNLVIDADANSRVISTAGALVVNGNFTITQGNFTVTNASHTITVGGNFTIDETSGGAFTDNLGTVILNGSGTQTIDNTAGSAISFNNLSLSGGGDKTLADDVTINGDLALSGLATILKPGSTTLTLKADLSFTGATIDAETSTLVFSGTGAQRISGSAGTAQITLNNLTINNTAPGNADVQLGIRVRVSGVGNFVTGVVASTSSNPLIFLQGSSVSYDGVADDGTPGGGGIDPDGDSYVSGPIKKVGNGSFNFPTGDGAIFARVGISGIGSPDAADIYTAQYFKGTSPNFKFSGNPSNANPKPSAVEYWDVDRSGMGQPQITLYWEDGDRSGISDISTLTVAHFTGGNWVNEQRGSTGGAGSKGYVTSGNQFTSFSPVAQADEANNGLPVELMFFEGAAIEDGVQLRWKTASEYNNDYFEVQHSTNGVAFSPIGQVKGHGSTTQPRNYGYTHHTQRTGIHYYRLRQVDWDGTEEYSAVVAVVIGSVDFAVKAYPNPFHDALTIEGTGSLLGTRVMLFDRAGRAVFTHTLENTTKASINMEGIPAGVYRLLINAPGHTHSQWVVKE